MNLRLYKVLHVKHAVFNITHTEAMRIKADHGIIIRICSRSMYNSFYIYILNNYCILDVLFSALLKFLSTCQGLQKCVTFWKCKQTLGTKEGRMKDGK